MVLGYTKVNEVIVSQPKYMIACKRYLQNDVDAWKEYLKWNLLNSLQVYLHLLKQQVLILW
jgi:hypothetical protein